MASHVSQCMAKACMCVTHGMPCVTMHGLLKAYIISKSVCVEGAARSSPWEQQGEGGGREKRKGGKEKRREERKGEREENGGKWRKRRRKEKKKGEEERKKKEEKGRSVAQ